MNKSSDLLTFACDVESYKLLPIEILELAFQDHFADEQAERSFWVLFFAFLSIEGQKHRLGKFANLRVKYFLSQPYRMGRGGRGKGEMKVQLLAISNDQFLRAHADPIGVSRYNREEWTSETIADKYGEVGHLVFELTVELDVFARRDRQQRLIITHTR